MAKYLTSNSFDFRDAVDILEATYEGNLPRLELLFHNRALSINFAVDGIYSGMTPLHIAACKGYTDIVHWIIHDYKGGKRHMGVRIKESGYTPLHSVIIGQPVDPPPNNPGPVTRSGVVALSKEEEEKKRTDVVKELLSTGDTDANAMANFKVTPLHLAAKTGQDEIVKQLLDWEPKDGIYMNQRINLTTVDDTFENTALHLAAGGGYDGVVKELLKYYKRNQMTVREIGPTNKMRATPLHVAALQGYFNVVETLLECGAPVNKTAEGGYTPLHFAVFAVCSKTIAVLLKKAEGLMVSEADWQGLTPIEWAKRLCQTVPNEFTDFTPNARKENLVNWRQETSDIRDLLEGFDVHGLRKDKQGYMDSANAILVGAALIASITFSSWLQPPLGFQFAMVSTDAPSTNYVLMEKTAMQGFWVFNSFSFCFAIATVVAGANAALQKRNLSLKDTVAEMRRNVLRASICLFFAVVGVLGAFACAGFVDLPSGRRYRWYVGAPLLVGGLACLYFLGALFKSILDSFSDWQFIPSLKGITNVVYGVYNLLRWAGRRLGCLRGTDAAQGSGATSSSL